MRILLAHNSLYFPSHGGGDKSNRLLMESLAARGHEVRVMARLEDFSPQSHEAFVADLGRRDAPILAVRDGGVLFLRNGVSVFTVTTDPRIRTEFAKQIAEWDPDVILCSTDDPGALLLEVALRASRARIVYLVRATVAVPFGPDCAFPNASKTEMIGRVDSIIGVSHYVADYVRRWSSFPAIHVPISLLEPGDYSSMGRFENEWVLMVNPCAVKGISIFLALADALPDVSFAAVPTWGTNPEDLAALRKRPNIRLLDPVDDIADLLRRTRVVLVPSVWAEARSRMVVESMIRGIPVIASDVGGLHEAKLGVEYLLPVTPIQRYRAHVDANMVPMAEVPPQNIQPWILALERLLADAGHYRDVAERSRTAAVEYAEQLHSGWLESHLQALLQQPKKSAKESVPGPKITLSPAKQKLLALRLQQQRAAAVGSGEFFPAIRKAKAQPCLLFCFPWAGAGSISYLAWESLLRGYGVCPVRLPGRESRSAEPPFTAMASLIEALVASIRPHLDRPFLFYGHSMGAGLAFELCRALRRLQSPMPQALLVASARAPQFRTEAQTGSLTDEEILEQLERRGEMPSNPDTSQLLLPALRADVNLYRHYRYVDEPPLSIPLHAFWGVDDASLSRADIAAWSAQTHESFTLTEVPAGHLFINDPSFIQALRNVLAASNP